MDDFNPINLLQIPVFLFALTFHEFAHAWAAKKGGDMTSAYLGRLTLNPIVHIDPVGTIILPLIALFTGVPMLGWAKPVPVNELKFRRSDWIVWVSLAGPISNVILAAAAALIMKVALMLGGPAVQQSFLLSGAAQQGDVVAILFLIGKWFILINVLLALFNMLPIPPLDGSKLIYQYYIKNNPRLLPLWAQMNQFGFLLLYAMLFFPPFRDGFSYVFAGSVNYIFSWLLNS